LILGIEDFCYPEMKNVLVMLTFVLFLDDVLANNAELNLAQNLNRLRKDELVKTMSKHPDNIKPPGKSKLY
jgi:hypothetical protein